jgi:acyl carrier protein
MLEIVSQETGIGLAALRPEAMIEDLGITSLDLTQALFAIESEFDIEIPVVPNSTGAEFTTIGELVRHVLAVLDQPAAQAAAAPVNQPA